MSGAGRGIEPHSRQGHDSPRPHHAIPSISMFDQACILLTTFGVACCGVAVVLYALGFLLHALHI